MPRYQLGIQQLTLIISTPASLNAPENTGQTPAATIINSADSQRRPLLTESAPSPPSDLAGCDLLDRALIVVVEIALALGLIEHRSAVVVGDLIDGG
jgi:hypothetical protein